MNGWAPTNIDVRTQNIDTVLDIPGISNLIAQKISADTFCNLNVFSGLNQTIAPNGFDRYVLGFWHEVFDENIFLDLYNNNPQSEFIILTDMSQNDLTNFKRCKYVQLFHWNTFLNFTLTRTDSLLKKYKISSLSNRVNEYKFFVTAKLLNSNDTFLTWNANYLKNVSYDYIFSPAGWPQRDSLLVYQSLLKEPINQQRFVNDPVKSIRDSATNTAYTESLINLINETKDNSWHQNFGKLPGPYITEKTWKPLLRGNALLFSSQCDVKSSLEKFGFNFDYPWSNQYSTVCEDLERLDLLLNLIDQILDMSMQDITQGIEESIKHNQNLIVSGQLQKKINAVNCQGLDILADIL
jgi:hypothetical protein